MPGKKRPRKDAGIEKFEEEYRSLADEQLRKSLIDIGENPGPIDSSNRDIYIRLLVRKKLKLDTTTETASSSSTSLTPSSMTPPLVRASYSGHTPPKKIGKGTPISRSPLVAAKKLVIPTATLTRLSASPVLTAKPKVSQMFEIKGLVAATFTPFNADGEVELTLIKPYCDFLLRQGINKIFVNGTTGESLSLTVEERKLIAEQWVKVSGGRLTIIIHVGCESLKSSCELAAHAEELGVSAIGVMPTTFFKPQTIDALVLYLQKVGEAAPCTPMLYYHIPVKTGVTLSMEQLVDRAVSDLPTFRGIKYTDEDLMQYSRCVAHSNNYVYLYGRDEQVLSSLCMGGVAAVGSTYNYCGKLNGRLFQAYHKGDMTTALLEQRRSQAGIDLLRKYGPGAGKAFMKLSGMDLGPPRLPIIPLSMDEIESLKTDLQSIGYFDWA